MIDKGFKDLSQVAIWGPLLIAGLILGCEPSPTDGSLQESPGQPWFEEVAQSSGLSFEHETGKTGRFLMPEVMVGGGALFDMDNDGDLDAYLVQSGSFVDEPAAGPVNRLFRNRGDGKFDDVTTNSGADHRGYGSGVAAGDYNNDGLVDLYVTNVGPNMLLRNDGAGHFTDVTEKTGVGIWVGERVPRFWTIQ